MSRPDDMFRDFTAEEQALANAIKEHTETVLYDLHSAQNQIDEWYARAEELGMERTRWALGQVSNALGDAFIALAKDEIDDALNCDRLSESFRAQQRERFENNPALKAMVEQWNGLSGNGGE